MEKSVDAFRTISEVAIDLEVTQHVLRFWETKFPQVKPLKRGGGRRYYRPDDVNLLRSIRSLLYREGYTIRGVQQILKAQGARAVAALATQDDRIELSTTAAVELSEPHAPSEDDRAAMPPQPSGPDKLPDDFFDRPLPNPIVPMERWRILTLIEEVQACAQRLAIAHSRHVALVEKARSALSSSPLNHSVDAP